MTASPDTTLRALDQATGSTAASTRTLRYTRAAILLHWAIAGLVFVAIPFGLYGANAAGDLAQSSTNAHKTIGILILFLTLGRLAWRLGHRPPELSEATAPWLHLLARAVHGAFYLLLLALPLSGWWMSSAVPKRHPFGLPGLDVPFLPVRQDIAAAGAAHGVHVNLGWAVIALIALHVAAALKHRFVDRDRILARMLWSNR